MDAASLLRLNTASPGPMSAAVVNNLRSLVRDGRLLPWLNEAFPVPSDRVKMIDIVVRRHGCFLN